MNSVLQFGIPSFDVLFGRGKPVEETKSYNYPAYGIQLPGGLTTSMCLIGPDGTGKSVFGLHLAAHYMASADFSRRRNPWRPRVFYISTDLKYQVAEIIWNNFGLDKPNRRDFPFFWNYRKDHTNSDLKVKLAPLDPSRIDGAILGPSVDDSAEVHFVDLVSKTMGDDWGFINRLLAVLRSPDEGREPHLLVIDAVEGFEMLVGEKDAFGEITSRRARIAQIMRTAGEKCHVCFMVEEPKNDERFPEEFVTNVVVRLRSVVVNNYSRRTLEIVKARGQSHVRGQHPFVIRDGKLMGSQPRNPDEPEVKNSYVHVFPSIHYLSREGMKAESPTDARRQDRVAAFGITYLDQMLHHLDINPEEGRDDQGLPAQTTTALIGEIATQKTSLATAFLARTFRTFAFGLAKMIREFEDKIQDDGLIYNAIVTRVQAAFDVLGPKDHSRSHTSKAAEIRAILQHVKARDDQALKPLLEHRNFKSIRDLNLKDKAGRVPFLAWLAGALPDTGATVLVTTGDQIVSQLIDDMDRWLASSKDKARHFHNLHDSAYDAPFSHAVKEHVRERTICRRLEHHDLSSATLFQIVQRSIERAQQKVLLRDHPKAPLPYLRADRFARSWNIRVVIDDLSTLKDAYPEVGSDPIFLPFLLSFLELEGVTALIINSQMGRPDAPVTDALDRELRALVPHKIQTWRVPFFGGMRDAITAVPPFPSGLPSLIREVRWQSGEGEHNALVVDPEMELYSGLGQGDPKPIPLEIRLYESATQYIEEQNEILTRLFTPLDTPGKKIVIGMGPEQYETMRDFCNLHTHMLLNHTMVMQIDEFWAADHNRTPVKQQLLRGPISRREGTLHPLGRYLTESTSVRTFSANLVVDRVTDPFGVFQGRPVRPDRPDISETGPWQRLDYFFRSAQNLSSPQMKSHAGQAGSSFHLKPSDLARIDRVPYAWDFGFLLCPPAMWEFAAEKDIGRKGHHVLVKDVWEKMPSVIDRDIKGFVSWREFLGACRTVAQAQTERSSQVVRVFDLSMLPGESFSCLVLEIWASEIAEILGNQRGGFQETLRYRDWDSEGDQSLITWLKNDDYRLAFYRTWLLLLDALPLTEIVEGNAIPRLKIRNAEGPAAATRHWYKTACGHQDCPVTRQPCLPVRLPGRFSVRGDWFLAVAGGSRSERLACRALDLLSTRRANFRRMELGIGLPTRDIAAPTEFDNLPTALVKRDHKGRTTSVTYGELIGRDGKREIRDGSDHFSWFWRSRLRDYHRHNRPLQQWFAQAVAMWKDVRNELGVKWKTGFDVYDNIEGKHYLDAETILKDFESWKKFKNMCNILINQLEVASKSAPQTHAEEIVEPMVAHHVAR